MNQQDKDRLRELAETCRLYSAEHAMVHTHSWLEVTSAFLSAHKAITSLLEENEALARDAARYRWLRSNWFTMATSYTGGAIRFHLGEQRWSRRTEQDLDDTIDSAMQPKGD